MAQDFPGKKSYAAPTLRKALQRIQDELGPDALILCTRRTADGVSIDAALPHQVTQPEPISAPLPEPAVSPQPEPTTNQFDNIQIVLDEIHDLKEQVQSVINRYDDNDQKLNQQQHTHDITTQIEHELKPKMGVIAQKIYHKLLASGFEEPYCQKIVGQLEEIHNMDRALAQTSELIARDLPDVADDIIDHQGAIALVGGTGVGKTTTIAKLAARFLNVYGKDDISLISSDFYSVGGREQLRIYGKILDIPIHMVSNIDDLEDTLSRLTDKRLILIDTAGMSPRDVRLTQKLNLITHLNIPLKTYLVFPSAYIANAINHSVELFNQSKISGAIVTKMDECQQLGHALSACIAKQIPIQYLSMGQNVPGDLKHIKPKDLAQRALQLETKVKELIHG